MNAEELDLVDRAVGRLATIPEHAESRAEYIRKAAIMRARHDLTPHVARSRGRAA